MKPILIIMIFLLTLTSVTAVNMTNSLQSYYSFDNSTSNITNIVDLHGNRNLTSTTGWGYSFNQILLGTSLYGNNSLSKPTYDTTTFDFDDSDFTINFWVNITSLTNQEYFISIKNDSGTSYIVFRISGGNYQFGTKGSSSASEVTTPVILSNSSQMITLVKQGTYMSIYIDSGIYNTQNITAQIRKDSHHLYIGGIYNQAIDELSLWSNAISPNTIINLYNNGAGLNYTQTLNLIYLGNITYNNGNISIGQGIFSKNQCIENNGNDYLCNDSYYNPYDNAFYCNVDALIPCGINKYCITYIYDMNNSEVFAGGTSKDCTTMLYNESTLEFFCSDFYKYTPITNLLLQTFGYSCNTNSNYELPSAVCSDTSQSDFIALYPDDTFYTEGQCQSNPACLGTCTPNTYGCFDDDTPIKCDLLSNGCYDWNFTGIKCVGDYTCSSGSCVIVPNGDSGSGDDTSGMLFGEGLTTFQRYLLILVVLITTIVGFGVFGGTQSHLGLGFIVGIVIAVFELITFTILGWIPVWVMIMLLLVSIAVSILMSKSSSGGSGY